MYKKQIRIINILLSVLLVVSIFILSEKIIYKYIFTSQSNPAVLANNIITLSTGEAQGINVNKPSVDLQKTNTAAVAEINNISKVNSAISKKKEKALTLYSTRNTDNLPFSVENMFPGDSINKSYCVQVSYKNTITVRYYADIKPGYEKLAEVLKVKIVLINTDETLYDGLMRDMPEALKHTLTSNKPDTEELYYEVTAYLGTEVGNEYQNKDLVADFQWWVEETGNLEPPKTGDTFNPIVWIILAGASSLVIILLLFVKKYRRSSR